MPLGIDHLSTVGFILGTGSRDGKWVDDKTIGTGFRVTIRGEKRLHGYLVTAKHVLKDQEDPHVRFRVEEGEKELLPIRGWWESEKHDVAVAELDDPGEERRYAISMEDQAWDALGLIPELGANVYYMGLLDPVPSMGVEGIPMVRSGTLGAVYQTIEPKNAEPYVAHLVDCRSYGGFSGSPVLVQIPFPGPRPQWMPGPDELFRASVIDPALPDVGAMRYYTMLIGLFKSHFEDRNLPEASNLGIGVVVPVEAIREVLEHEVLVARRKKAEEEDPEEPNIEEVDLSTNRDESAGLRRDDFIRDLEKASERVTRKRPEKEA